MIAVVMLLGGGLQRARPRGRRPREESTDKTVMGRPANGRTRPRREGLPRGIIGGIADVDP